MVCEPQIWRAANLLIRCHTRGGRPGMSAKGAIARERTQQIDAATVLSGGGTVRFFRSLRVVPATRFPASAIDKAGGRDWD